MAKKKVETDPIRRVLGDLQIPQSILEYSDLPVAISGSYSYVTGWCSDASERNRWWIDDRDSVRDHLRKGEGFVGGYAIIQWRRIENKGWPWELRRIVVRTDFGKSRNEIAEWLRRNLP